MRAGRVLATVSVLGAALALGASACGGRTMRTTADGEDPSAGGNAAASSSITASVTASAVTSVATSATTTSVGGAGGASASGVGGAGITAAGGVTSDGTGGASGAAGAGGTSETFCVTTCENRHQHSCFYPPDCLEQCTNESSTWPPAVSDAFAVCAAGDPLCFQTMADCMLAVLHPGAMSHLVRLEGSGFEAQEGSAVYAWNESGVEYPFEGNTVIAGGAFELEWIPAFWAAELGPSILLFVDVNGDGACTEAVDPTDSVPTYWNGDYLDPVYEIALTSPRFDLEWVCDWAD